MTMPGLQLSDRFNRYEPLKPEVERTTELKVAPKATKPKPGPVSTPVEAEAPKAAPKPRKPKPEVVGETWFAIQTEYERPSELVKIILTAANSERILFRRLDTLGTFTVGRHTFLRMKADHPDLAKVFRRLVREHCLVTGGIGGYSVTLPDGRFGKVPASTMHTLPSATIRKQYLGTKMKHWQQQF